MSNDATIVAGTHTYWKVKGAAGNMLLLDGLRSTGKVGSTGSFVDQTTLADKVKRYVSGMKDTEESTMRIAIYSSNDNQKKFIQAAQDSLTIQLKMILPPDTSGNQMVIEFDVALSGRSLPELSDGNALQEFEIAMRISGEPVFNFAVAGDIYGIASLSVTTAGAVALSDGDYVLTQGNEFLTSGNGTGAQITVTVANNTITVVKSIDKAGLGYAQNDTLNISRIFGVNMTTAAILTVDTVS